MKQTNIKSRLLIAALVLCLALVATLATFTVAKYILDSKQDDLGIVEGADFVFYSDLSENTADAPYKVYDGEINFRLKNYNALITTQNEITYTVSVSGGAGTILVDGAAYGTSQTLTKDSDGEDLVSISGLGNGLYTVTVSSTAPYAKTFELYFSVERTDDRTYYTVTRHDTWCELDIYTGASASDVTVEYTGAPDNTDDRMETWQKNSSGVLRDLESYAHYKLIFFNASTFRLTQDGETVEQGGSGALNAEGE